MWKLIFAREVCSHGEDQHPRGQISNWHNAVPYPVNPTPGPVNDVALSTADNDPSTACQIAVNTTSIPVKAMSTTTDITPADLKIPEQLNSGSQYVVLGSLILPRPPEARRALAEKWEHELCKLDTRNMEDLHPLPITDIASSFERSRAEEPHVWGEDAAQDNKYLVKPSGSLQSPLVHRLNQPSWTTANLENGETADETNGCIDMVMGNAYTPDTLIYDHIHRRDAESNGIQEYPTQVRVIMNDPHGILASQPGQKLRSFMVSKPRHVFYRRMKST